MCWVRQVYFQSTLLDSLWPERCLPGQCCGQRGWASSGSSPCLSFRPAQSGRAGGGGAPPAPFVWYCRLQDNLERGGVGKSFSLIKAILHVVKEIQWNHHSSHSMEIFYLRTKSIAWGKVEYFHFLAHSWVHLDPPLSFGQCPSAGIPGLNDLSSSGSAAGGLPAQSLLSHWNCCPPMIFNLFSSNIFVSYIELLKYIIFPFVVTLHILSWSSGTCFLHSRAPLPPLPPSAMACRGRWKPAKTDSLNTY